MSIQIQIDNHPLIVEKGLTILQAARENHIEIPTLCDFPGLPSPGSCRMCVVEILGRANMPTSCTTPAEDGMKIYTQSPKVRALRAELLQMLLSEHPSGCLFCPENTHCEECMVTLRKAAVTTGCSSCPKDEQCELQSLVEEYQVDKPGYPMRYRMLPVERHDPFFDRDYNLCILCGRCIRVCENLHFTGTLAFTKRGTHTLVGTSFYHSHLESSCTFCGACVEVCPTGALSEKTRKWDGLAERETASTCPLCSIGCEIKLLSKKERIIGSLPEHGSGKEGLCVKGRFGITELVNHPTRLKIPQKRVEHTMLKIDWEEALYTAAEKLKACSPERFKMRISASCTIEDLYVAKKFVREVMKSANIHTSPQASLGDAAGVAAPLLQHSKPLQSIQNATLVLCLGFEDKYAHSVIEVQLHRAKEQGVKIITLGERRMPWSGHADLWLHAEPGLESTLVQELAQLTRSGAIAGDKTSDLQRAASMLRESNHPVVLLGPAALTNLSVLQSVEALIRNLDAQLIALPELANQSGALWLGLHSDHSIPAEDAFDVLYLIGEKVPNQLTGQPFILYQNIYPPSGGCRADLILPAAAFTEREGSYLSSDRRARTISPAVQPAGESMSDWLIISRIAQAMGAPGFDYNRVEDIQAEIPALVKAMKTGSQIDWQGDASNQPIYQNSPPEKSNTHIYMGYPLAQWVEGLQSLYPDQTNGRVK